VKARCGIPQSVIPKEWEVQNGIAEPEPPAAKNRSESRLENRQYFAKF
jgi:hypothetical protein